MNSKKEKSKNRKRNSWMVLIILLFANPVLAQVDNLQDSGLNSASEQLYISSIEQQYDSHISRQLSSYFESHLYNVFVEIDSEVVNETFQYFRQDQIINDRVRTSLPGLPYIPQRMLRTDNQEPEFSSSVEEYEVPTIRINSVLVTVYVDTSFTQSQIEFLSALTERAAKTEPDRGDQVNVIAQPFPQLNSLNPPVSVQIPQSDVPQIENIYNVLLILGIVFLILIIILVIAGWYYLQKPSPTIVTESIGGRSQQQPPPMQSKSKKESKTTFKFDYDDNSELDKLTEVFIKNPREVALIFEYWISQESSSGLKKSASVVASMDRKMLRTIKQMLNPNVYLKIKHVLDQLSPLSSDEKEEIARDFLKEFSVMSKKRKGLKKFVHTPLLKFLSELPKEKLFKILEAEYDVTVAIILDFMEDEEAAEIVQRFKPRRAADILLQLSKLNELSYEEYKNISDDLFDRIMDNYEDETGTGQEYEQIFYLLEQIPESGQKELMDELSKMNSYLGKNLTNRFIMFEDLERLDDEFLKKAMYNISTQTIIKALSNASESIKNKILKTRHHREQTLIRFELEDERSYSTEEINDARSDILQEVRRLRKAEGSILQPLSQKGQNEQDNSAVHETDISKK